MKNIIDTLYERWPDRTCWLFFGCRTTQDVFYLERFRELASEHPNFHVIYALSDELEDGEQWDGETGFIHLAVDKHLEAGVPRQAFLCGPPLMIEAVTRVLIAKGLPRKRSSTTSSDAAVGHCGQRDFAETGRRCVFHGGQRNHHLVCAVDVVTGEDYNKGASPETEWMGSPVVGDQAMELGRALSIDDSDGQDGTCASQPSAARPIRKAQSRMDNLFQSTSLIERAYWADSAALGGDPHAGQRHLCGRAVSAYYAGCLVAVHDRSCLTGLQLRTL